MGSREPYRERDRVSSDRRFFPVFSYTHARARLFSDTTIFSFGSSRARTPPTQQQQQFVNFENQTKKKIFTRRTKKLRKSAEIKQQKNIAKVTRTC